VTPVHARGIVGWEFAKHTGSCVRCDMASDAYPSQTHGVELHVDTGALCEMGRKLLEIEEEGVTN